MKQVKCVITDDEPTACEGLQRYVEKVDFLSLMGVCEDTMQLNTLLQTEQPDLLFLDIEMPQLNGMKTAEIMALTMQTQQLQMMQQQTEQQTEQQLQQQTFLQSHSSSQTKIMMSIQ